MLSSRREEWSTKKRGVGVSGVKTRERGWSTRAGLEYQREGLGKKGAEVPKMGVRTREGN